MKSNQINVIHLMTGFGGGISSFILNKADGLKNDESIKFNVITFDDVSEQFRNSIENTGGFVHKIPSPSDNFVLFIKRTYTIFRQEKDNTLIHSHFGMNLVILFYFLSKLAGIKRFIIHAHTDAPFEVKYSRKNKFRRFINSYLTKEKVSCGSGATENIFGKKYLIQNSVMHIPNSIDINKFLIDKKSDIIEEKKEAFLLKSKFKKPLIIGHIGRFHPQKNHEYMVQLIKMLALKKVEFIWLFIGDGPLLNEMKKVIKDNNLEDYVLFLGRRNDIPDLLSIMDIFVLPSLYEGLPTVAVESQAAGVKSIFSTEITREVDLGMGLATFIPLESEEGWINAIIENEHLEVSKEYREEKLIEKKFTNNESSKLYKDFINKKITSYKI